MSSGMNKLHIKARKDSPEVLFDPDSCYFSIVGVSHPENVSVFYDPVFSWLDSFLEEVNQVDTPCNTITLRMFFKYINSATYKYLISLLQLMNRFIDYGIEVSVVWQYEPDDEDMKESGYELIEYSGSKAKFICEVCYDPI